MKKSKKILIIIALALIASGIIIVCFTSLFTIGSNTAVPFLSDSVKLEEDYGVKTIQIEENFHSIEVYETDANVKILPLESDSCKISYKNSRRVNRSISVENGVLKFKAEESKNFWDHFGLFFDDNCVTEIYLQKDQYDKIRIITASGNIEVLHPFKTENFYVSTASGEIDIDGIDSDYISVKSASGDIDFCSAKARYALIDSASGEIRAQNNTFDELNCSSISGNIYASGTSVSAKASITSTSGDIRMEKMSMDSLLSESTSGNIDFSSVTAKNSAINTTSGEFTFYEFETENAKINTVSGNVNGSFKTSMLINTSTTSGNIDVIPSLKDGGECSITTVSGDIKIY